jgi:hypothetical protein
MADPNKREVFRSAEVLRYENINTCFLRNIISLTYFLFIFISLIDSFFISDLKIKQEIKLVRVKLVKKARFYAINKAIAIQLVL